MEDKIILQPDPARIMEGLRDTGYDFNTAMADLVDNSIAAHATKIKVSVTLSPSGDVAVHIADNGCGMDFDGLKNAMRYGSQRRTDASSLGKFGLGLKTASTAFCRSLSVMSKNETSEYRKVQWDLDEVCKRNEWELLCPPVDEDEIDLLEDVTNGGAGTLVIWDKVDRLMKAYSSQNYTKKAFERIVANLKQHFAMVYQRFLDPEFESAPTVDLFLNEEKVEPWDPFCLKEKNTNLIAKQDVEVEIAENKKSAFTLKAYILPRVEEFSTPEAKATAKISNDYEGFYVYRENRLIYFGDWLGMFVSDPHFSLLRVEFNFDHSLDEAFNVDIKKSKILLAEEIFQWIKESFMPAPRRQAADIYRKGQNKKVAAKGQDGAHDSSNTNISDKADKVQGSKVTVDNAETGDVTVQNSNGTTTGKIRVVLKTPSNRTRVIPIQNLDDGMLWEPTIAGDNQDHAVSINQSHDYYKKVYAPVLGNSVMVTGMDALLWALSEAELSTYNQDTKEYFEDMRAMVSRILKKLVADLPDPEIEEE